MFLCRYLPLEPLLTTTAARTNPPRATQQRRLRQAACHRVKSGGAADGGSCWAVMTTNEAPFIFGDKLAAGGEAATDTRARV